MQFNLTTSSRKKRTKVGRDLPFADPADILEVHHGEDQSNWASGPLAEAVAKLRAAKRPKPVLTLEPKPDPRATPPPLRRRFRYHIQRPINSEAAVSVAPAARSARRFTEHTAIRDAEGVSWRHWPEVLTVSTAVIIGIWMLLSL